MRFFFLLEQRILNSDTLRQVGLTYGQTIDDWIQDMTLAHSACIDGFALNIGPSDPYTLEQLRHAFAAATELSQQGRAFSLFPSFDMACGSWSVEQVVALISEFQASPVYYAVNGLPFVSTFEGPGWAENWEAVRAATGGIYLVPDWSSLGPEGVGHKLGWIDGAFSWSAWPRAGEARITTVEDGLYRRALRGKAYMMGVSPWFYTSRSGFFFSSFFLLVVKKTGESLGTLSYRCSLFFYFFYFFLYLYKGKEVL